MLNISVCEIVDLFRELKVKRRATNTIEMFQIHIDMEKIHGINIKEKLEGYLPQA